jgi:peptidoglycan/LPS O-acetylase OafA/YrhL
LTILRFVAAFWVLGFHLQTRVPLPVPEWARGTIGNGALAMSLFFVLSGAMLAYGYGSMQLRAADLAGFYRARFARIVPAYAVVHLIALIWFTPNTSGGTASWLYINLLSVVGLQAWVPHSVLHGANGGTWSVSVELFFYTLFPLLIVLLGYAQRRFGFGRLLLATWIAVSFVSMAGFVFPSGLLYYVLPPFRLPEFVCGILIGLALNRSPTRGMPGWGVAVALLAAVAAAANPLSQIQLWTTANFAVVPAFAALIYVLARYEAGRPIDLTQRLWRFVVYLGESSYCLFLFHLVPLLFLDSPLGQSWKNAAIRIHGAAWLCGITIVVSLIGAFLLHELVEKPARHALLRRWKTPSVPREDITNQVLETKHVIP